MTAFPKILIMLALWLLYTFLVWRGCSDELCTNCGAGTVTDVPPTTDTSAVRRYPLDFKWSDPTAYTNVGFDSLRQSILAKSPENGILEITGLYYEAEPKPAGFANMGFARAEKVKALMTGIPADRIQTRARLIDETAGVRTGYFEGALFDWREAKQTTARTVEELADRIIIRFPFGSLEKEYEPAVDEYLTKLATRVKETGETITLTGHTDNVGNDAGNLSFGKRRAEAIKAILVRNGIKADQISTDSKGESQPVATNDTDQGRHENRRVEVRLVKKQ